MVREREGGDGEGERGEMVRERGGGDGEGERGGRW